MKILVVGGGSREHAIAEAIARSSSTPRIFSVSENRNPGIRRIVEESGGEYALAPISDPGKVAELASRWGVEIAVIGPEEPGFHGVADSLRDEDVAVVGAVRKLAVMEMSKAEMRRMQWRNGVPGRLLFKTYHSFEEAMDDLRSQPDAPTWTQNVALKPARQAGGKGVKVIEDGQAYLHREKAEFKVKHAEWIDRYISGYGDLEERILVEEKVWGPEYTLQCFSDGYTISCGPLVQDNKNAFEHCMGPETGGMGSYAGPGPLLPFITREEYDRSVEIVKKMVDAVQRESGERYVGFVAGQMMLTELEGPTLIEMYSRLGDPEGVNLLALLETDFVDLLEAMIDGKLSSVELKFSEEATVVKALAPKGYPDDRRAAGGHPIMADEGAMTLDGCKLYWGSVHEEDGLYTTGSRAAEILAFGSNLPEASEIAERCTGAIRLLDGWGLYHRSDIGSKHMLERMDELADRARALYKYREERGTLGKRKDWIPGLGLVDPAQELERRLRG